MSVIEGIKGELRYFRYMTPLSRLSPVAADPVATHLPVLLGLDAMCSPRVILELGAGTRSTVAFADHSAFPHVQRIHSLEDDDAWANKVTEAIGQNDRVTIERVASIPDHVATMDLSPFDLIFVDDSSSAPARGRSIASVLARAPENAIVVIHDYERRSYRRKPAIWNNYSFGAWRTHTGVLWRQGLSRARLAVLDRTIRNHRDYVALTDLAGWRRLLGTT